jgi:hypothetical protein
MTLWTGAAYHGFREGEGGVRNGYIGKDRERMQGIRNGIMTAHSRSMLPGSGFDKSSERSWNEQYATYQCGRKERVK